MDNNKKITISRREFNQRALATGIAVAGLQIPISYGSEIIPDGLIQLKDDGRVYLYSSGSQLGLYDDFSNVEKLALAAGASHDDLVIVNIDNPGQLPCMLGQKTNALSHSDLETSIRAATWLGRARKSAHLFSTNPTKIIEPGVSQSTRDIIEILDQEGIILAARGKVKP